MKYVYLILGWLLGSILLIAGVAALVMTPMAGVILIVASALLLPPVRQWAFRRTQKSLSPKARVVAMGALFFIFIVAINHDAARNEKELAAQEAMQRAEQAAKDRQERIDYFHANRESILAEAKAALDAKDYQRAIVLSSKYVETGDPELLSLNASAKERLAEIRKQELTAKLLADLKTLPASDAQGNQKAYAQLASLYPDSTEYRSKLDQYNAKVKEEQEAQQRAERRKKQLESQFSAWDGSHRGLERVIKDSMNDPDSYDHVETVYWDRGDHLVVRTTFRGKNAFGGVVKNSVKARVSLDGQVLEILDH